MHFIDVGTDSTARSQCLAAESVAAYTAESCQLIGFLRAEGVDARAISWTFAESDRKQFLADATALTGLLLTPDGTATVTVSTFGGHPTVRLCTVLQDGRLIETHTRWHHVPARNPTLVFTDYAGSVEQQMRRGHTPRGGRSILVIAPAEPSDVLAAHEAHVRRLRSGASAFVVSTEQAVAHFNRIVKAAMDHTTDAVSRTGSLHSLLFGLFTTALLTSLAVAVYLRAYAFGVIASLLGAWALTGWLHDFAARAATKLLALRPPPFPGVPTE